MSLRDELVENERAASDPLIRRSGRERGLNERAARGFFHGHPHPCFFSAVGLFQELTA